MEVTKRADVVAAVHRGGWDHPLASVTTVLEYMIQSPETLATAGKALAGWPDPKQSVYPPRCVPIMATLTAADEDKMYKVVQELFITARFSMLSGNLKPFAMTMFAAILMYLPEFIAAYGDKHIVITNLCAAATRFNVTMPTLLRWGALLKEDWRARNKNALAAAVDWRCKIEEVEASVNEVKTQQRHMSVQMDHMQVSVQEMLTNQRIIMGLLQKLTIGSPGDLNQISAATAPAAQDLLSPPPTAETVSTAKITAPPGLFSEPAFSPQVATPQNAAAVNTNEEGTTHAVKRPRSDAAGSFLSAPPSIVEYKNALSSYDIAELYHDSLRVGFIVDVPRGKRQDRQRLRAVENHARELLKRADSITMSLKARLSTPPPLQCSPAWLYWKEQHLAACRELKELVKRDLNPGNWPSLQSTSVSAIGSRILTYLTL